MEKKSVKKRQEFGSLLARVHIGTSKNELLNSFEQNIVHRKRSFIVTLNPEIALIANSRPSYLEILLKSNFILPDGQGIVMAADFLEKINSSGRMGILKKVFVFCSHFSPSSNKLTVVKGRELYEDLLGMASKRKLKVYLLGASEKTNKRLLGIVKVKFPGAMVMGSSGAVYDADGEPVDALNHKIHEETLKSLIKFRPDMVFVALGAPKQEIWIEKYLPRGFKGLCMGVGGSFDYMTGQAKVPPNIFESYEFLWRLINQPKRIPRVFNAVIKFPILVFLESFKRI